MKALGWLACLTLGACVASEAGNPSQRCDEANSCDEGEICYRGFCVVEETDIDPVEAPEEDAAPARDASVPYDAAPEKTRGNDASIKDVWTTDGPVTVEPSQPSQPTTPTQQPTTPSTPAPVVDASAPVPAPVVDASAPAPVVDAGPPCAVECRPPSNTSGQCKKCVEKAYGEEPDELCGKQGDDDDDKHFAITLSLDPFCISLCLGAASKDPSCIGQQLCKGPKCGGAP